MTTISTQQEADLKRLAEKNNVVDFCEFSVALAVEEFLNTKEYATVQHAENKIRFMGSFYRLGSVISL